MNTPPPLAPELHVCAECPLRYADVDPGAAAEMVRSFPGRYREALRGASDELLRRRPLSGVWSMLEYVCHARDVYAVYHERVTRTLAEDRPVLEPMGNDRRAAEQRYNTQPLPGVLTGLDGYAEDFAALVDSLPPDRWDRVCTRLPGEERTLLWLVRQAAHEGLHHLRDVERVRAAAESG